MLTVASLFSGGEGVGLGARAAGLRHLWGIERDDAIAQVARANGFGVITGDVTQIAPDTLERPDVLHASPECPNFSQAKQGAEETDEDIAAAQAIARFVCALLPDVFTLENVWRYRKSESWAIIRRSLCENGYWFDVAHANAADFGVPQTRKRMIVRALRGAMVPYLPLPEPWRGWYEAIEDLIPDLPETELAPWQLEGLPDELAETALLSQGISRDHKGNEYPLISRDGDEPAYAVTANSNRGGIRALLLGSNTVDGGAPPLRDGDRPALTVDTKTPGHLRAVLISNAKTEWGDGTGGPDEPAHSVTGQSAGRARAVLAGGQFGKPQGDGGETRPPQMSGQARPSFTVTASNKGDWRAVLVDSQNARADGITMRGDREPSFAVTAAAGTKGLPRILFGARIVSITPRCLARFQTFPDWYELPESKTLAARIIGNAVPPLMYEKITRGLTQYA